ncbi:MAG: hypothetical protein SFV17_03285 [Candidatus Obscuribacter sp.]|nr:hypothetical protein [Candidatus Melainabacteria bacterium]MDX1985689.1 hypothetical protein [Candidatus Obscuribacter sp.]
MPVEDFYLVSLTDFLGHIPELTLLNVLLGVLIAFIAFIVLSDNDNDNGKGPPTLVIDDLSLLQIKNARRAQSLGSN